MSMTEHARFVGGPLDGYITAVPENGIRTTGGRYVREDGEPLPVMRWRSTEEDDAVGSWEVKG